MAKSIMYHVRPRVMTTSTHLTMPLSSYDATNVRYLSSSLSFSRTLVDDADCGGCNTGTCIEPEITEGSKSALGPSCDCRDTGYIGEHCDTKCSKNCENGGKCIPADDDSNEETCSCTKAVVDGNPYAGLTCEYGATKSCMTLGSGSKHSFCVNGGECAYIVLDNEQHVPCVCGKEFEGPHCEYLTGKAPSLSSLASISSGGKTDLIVFILFAAIATVIGGLLLAFFLRGRQRRMEERRQEREARRATQEFAMVATDDDDNDII